MTTVYHDCASGEFIPSFLPGSYVYRTDEGKLAGKTVQIKEAFTCKKGGFVRLSVLATGTEIEVPYDIRELIKFKRMPSINLPPEERAILSERARKFNHRHYR